MFSYRGGTGVYFLIAGELHVKGWGLRYLVPTPSQAEIASFLSIFLVFCLEHFCIIRLQQLGSVTKIKMLVNPVFHHRKQVVNSFGHSYSLPISLRTSEK